MSITTIGLILLVCGYSLFLIYDGYIQANCYGRTLVAVRLRRRVVDAFFLSFIIVGGLYFEYTHNKHPIKLISLFLLLFQVLYHGLRFPKWRLKKTGFTAGGRFWSYNAIQEMRLSVDGVLVLKLTNNYDVILPVAFIDDLEKAAVFFAGDSALSHLTPGNKVSYDL